MNSIYTIGLDFGTDSVRCLIVNTENGEETASSVFEYPRWKKGLYCDPGKNQFRQHPDDYMEGLVYTVREALEKSPPGTAERVAALSADTTGSTPVAVDERGTPLSLTAGFRENPNAMFILWKDHTALQEAAEITGLARKWPTDYTMYEGGTYSSEWFWSKILHTLREDAAVLRSSWSWVEHCDWIPALLTGNTHPAHFRRSRCAAGHKAMWHPSFGGLPSEEFLTALDPLLAGLRDRLYRETYTCDVAAGLLSREWADRLGLPAGIPVGTGVLDAHMGSLGAEIKPYMATKVMGTSTCDMLVVPPADMKDKLVRGICGQVDGSIVPGLTGLEAGQSAFGDIYAWFRNLLAWPVRHILPESDLLENKTKEELADWISGKILGRLGTEAAKIPLEESGILALDWLNGRRTPDADENLRGAITGLNLGSNAPKIFRALIEATAFGSKAINERFAEEGVRIDGVIALGGVARKSPFVMQVVCDVLNVPIKVARSEQACALGAAMSAAVVAGVHPTIGIAQEKMGRGTETEYCPDPEKAAFYGHLYEKYRRLGKFIEKES